MDKATHATGAHIPLLDFESATRYIQALDYASQPQHTHQYAFDLGIVRTLHILTRMGGAPSSTQRCVLVTGSKGKGSTSMMIASVVAMAGYRVGVFTGPHLHLTTERFTIISPDPAQPSRIAKKDMPTDQFVIYANQIKHIVETWDRVELGTPTRFESFTAMAYRWFDELQLDLAVMEIGMGGRRDAVNLAQPIVSVITNISLEHTQMLGNTVSQIAQEKAGIFRKTGYGVSAQQHDDVTQMLTACAKKIDSPLEFAEPRWHVEKSVTATHDPFDAHLLGQWVCYPDFDDPNKKHTALLTLIGKHQRQNASAALCALNALRKHGYNISAAHVAQGFAQVNWPGRFEILSRKPTLVVDGAHTPYSMQQLGLTLREYFARRPIHLVLGVLRDKDLLGILTEVAGFADALTFVQPNYHRAMAVQKLVETWHGHFSHVAIPVQIIQPPTLNPAIEGIRAALSHPLPNQVICVTGSLHLVADAREVLQTPVYTSQPK